MIGVISRTDQAGVVGEFFELFKTPWEFYRAGRAYDVVLVTTDEVPEVEAKLTIVYGPGTKNIDASLGFLRRGKHQGGSLRDRSAWLPIYGELITFAGGSHEVCCRTRDGEIAGLQAPSAENSVLRVGYDLFEEVRHLMTAGQPIEHAEIPSLDIHIRILREWILAAELALLEIPPVPAGRRFAVCLTHDIDFVGIRRHWLDHSMWGFLYRATVGSTRNFLRGRLSLGNLLKSWVAAASLPLVRAGWVQDFWEPFEWYLEVEKGLPATYFLIPFKRRAGEKVPGRKASLRATAYDVSDIPDQTAVLLEKGYEVGVHGIDSWHNVDRGREEIAAVSAVSGRPSSGIRMHWLLRDAHTPSVLEQAGYSYDSTYGYNETIGYRAGTGQVFRPLDAESLLELPMHIQDGALFYPQRLDLSEAEAEKRCREFMANAATFGGVLTVLWHDRSHGPERFWGGFYAKLVKSLKSSDVWFGSAEQVVSWFRMRRRIRFETLEDKTVGIRWEGGEIDPAVTVRIYKPKCQGSADNFGSEGAANGYTDITWDGKSTHDLERQIALRLSDALRPVAIGPIS